jgi:septal ring factor EnvC (AmiA/AmiB activator)
MTTLTNQLTAQCKAINSTLNSYKNDIDSQNIMIDSLKSSDEEWAKNHFKLVAVEERQEELEKEIVELKKENKDLKVQV